MIETDVLIAGAGPVGLTAAVELGRRGIRCLLVDALTEPPRYAKAVGIQPRTLEVFEQMGVVREILDAAVPMRGQLVYADGVEVARTELTLPAGIPYHFIGLPQYETERVLRERLAASGITVQRGVRLTSFEQDEDEVRTVLADGGGERTVRARYLIGCDGAHSTVRKGLGLAFEGGAFAEQYMLGDVALDWSLPHGYSVRSTRRTDGDADDLLVCVPLPGRGRHRVSMLVPPDLVIDPGAGADTVAHGFEGGRRPELHHIQAVLDRLSPEPVTASDLRWSSVFRISHRIVDDYGRGRVFVAGDAAHIHPPTGAQGMNTGIQDAHGLAWKLALAVRGVAAPGLIASYDAERRPVGEEVVGRTVRDARQGVGAQESDADHALRRAAQLLIDYRDSPIVTPSAPDRPGPAAGTRAPDVAGLTRETTGFPFRLFTLFTGVAHVALCHLDDPADLDDMAALAESARAAAHGHLDAYLITRASLRLAPTPLPVIHDGAGDFARVYAPGGAAVYLVRPDGYLGYVASRPTVDGMRAHLRASFR